MRSFLFALLLCGLAAEDGVEAQELSEGSERPSAELLQIDRQVAQAEEGKKQGRLKVPEFREFAARQLPILQAAYSRIAPSPRDTILYADILSRLDSNALATAALNRSLAENPDSANLRLALGQSYLEQRDFAAGLAQAQAVLDREPHNKAALALRFQCKDRTAASKSNNPVSPPPSREPQAADSRVANPASPRRSISKPPGLSLFPSLQNAATNDPSLRRAAEHYSSHCASADKYSCDAAQISGNCFDSSAKNMCVRNCLVSDDEQCVKLDAAHKPGCRVKSHVRCYVFCRKFIPSIIEASCYTKMWGSFLGNAK